MRSGWWRNLGAAVRSGTRIRRNGRSTQQCRELHGTEGVGAAGTRGPDLTHVVGRRTLGAGIHENNRENLVKWTVDAQAMKPGNKMPRIPLAGDDLRALLAVR